MRKFVYLLLLLVFAVNTLFAAPANKMIISYKQSDGTELYIQLNGDEAFKYYSTIDGVPIVGQGRLI